MTVAIAAAKLLVSDDEDDVETDFVVGVDVDDEDDVKTDFVVGVDVDVETDVVAGVDVDEDVVAATISPDHVVAGRSDLQRVLQVSIDFFK